MGKTIWTVENIRLAMERYKAEYGTYPGTRDFDTCEYLPTARQIQRRFGGVPKFKQLLDLDGDYNLTTGPVRAAVASNAFKRSYEYEEAFYLALIQQIPEEQVHEQKRIRPGNVNCDFFIYNRSDKARSVVIDVFYAQNLFNMTGIINIKLKRYSSLLYRTFFVSIGNGITQEDIERLVANKKAPLPSHVKVCSEKWFLKNLQALLH